MVLSLHHAKEPCLTPLLRVIFYHQLQAFCFHLPGVKIIGGYRELSGEEFGIFIKRVLPGGVAAQDGMLALFHIINLLSVFL